MSSLIDDLIAGRVKDSETGEALNVRVKSVVLAPSLAGDEAALIKALQLPPPYAIISDPQTHEALGARIEKALSPLITIRLPARPHPDEETAAKVMEAGSGAGSYIAVGSGTINDLAKYAASRQGKRCAVFATAPSMNGYTSVNVAITIGGHKKSLPAVAPDGVFMDLGVLAAAPKRLIRAGLGDAICRSTAQGDWYMAHVLRGTPYRAMPFQLFADLEDGMVEEAAALVAGDLAAVERLAKVLLLSGFGMTICGGSYPASQGEHLISHTLEMAHAHGNGEEPLHGEQIAVTTMIMARLQDQMMAGEAPMARESTIGEAELVQQFGEETGRACWKELQPKLLDKAGAAAFTRRIAEHWPKLQNDLSRMRRPAAQIFKALKAAGAPTNYRDIGFTRQAISDAVQQARMIRNRYSFLDLAADSRRLIPERLVD